MGSLFGSVPGLYTGGNLVGVNSGIHCVSHESLKDLYLHGYSLTDEGLYTPSILRSLDGQTIEVIGPSIWPHNIYDRVLIVRSYTKEIIGPVDTVYNGHTVLYDTMRVGGIVVGRPDSYVTMDNLPSFFSEKKVSIDREQRLVHHIKVVLPVSTSEFTKGLYDGRRKSSQDTEGLTSMEVTPEVQREAW